MMRYYTVCFLALLVVLPMAALAEDCKKQECCKQAGACCKASDKATACAKAEGACATDDCPGTACAKVASACAKGDCQRSACDKASGCQANVCAEANDCPATACATSGDCQASACAEAEKIEHLQRALEHLMAAGLESEAEAVNKALVREMLAQKVAELHCLQAEVDALRQLADGKKQVKLHLKLMEVSLSEMEAKGIALPKGRVASIKYMGLFGNSKPQHAFTTCDGEAASKFVATVRDKKLARFLAEPTLVTVDGRPCTYMTAGAGVSKQASKPLQFQVTGTKVDAQVDVLDEQKVMLSVHPQLSMLEVSKPIPQGLSLLFVKVPELARFVGHMKLGEALFINGPIQERTVDGQKHKVQLFLVVTPEVAPANGPFSTARVPSPFTAR